jgi:hypothetical protein
MTPSRRPEPSTLPTVEAVLVQIRHSESGPTPATTAGRAARAAIPARRPHAQMFLAWELHYKNPDAMAETLRALDRR